MGRPCDLMFHVTATPSRCAEGELSSASPALPALLAHLFHPLRILQQQPLGTAALE